MTFAPDVELWEPLEPPLLPLLLLLLLESLPHAATKTPHESAAHKSKIRRFKMDSSSVKLGAGLG